MRNKYTSFVSHIILKKSFLWAKKHFCFPERIQKFSKMIFILALNLLKQNKFIIGLFHIEIGYP